MAIRLVAEELCLLGHFPLASTLHIVPSLSHVALHTGHNFWKEYILRFLKTPPFKNLKYVQTVVCFSECGTEELYGWELLFWADSKLSWLHLLKGVLPLLQRPFNFTIPYENHVTNLCTTNCLCGSGTLDVPLNPWCNVTHKHTNRFTTQINFLPLKPNFTFGNGESGICHMPVVLS